MVNYEYYTNVYSGIEISNEEDFGRLASRAHRIVKFYTRNRIDKEMDIDIEDMVKITICELAENLINTGKSNKYKQQSFGDWSATNNTVEDMEKEQESIVRKNLLYTGLLYKGGW